MKYLILIYTNPEARQLWEQMPEAARMEGLKAYAALNERLTESGEMIVSESLAEPSQTKAVTVRRGQASTTDGPFAETKEQLAGFYLVECESMERATEIAASIPEAEAGVVEVRPVRTYSGLEM
ncbi:YciI family protein [Phytoactinopolyspora halotolerans]|uniref:YciI family protein n=1 Tax=Phytoactinopolyspora halotolerans TaxID=1981512 RepID=A0A6L9S8Y1_9ACTN|nr:YciI family protein [Phytoactinopolyspora halotolerans]NEE01483.1 YciI family protein [Phytoactinopolyspora halotolerans]